MDESGGTRDCRIDNGAAPRVPPERHREKARGDAKLVAHEGPCERQAFPQRENAAGAFGPPDRSDGVGAVVAHRCLNHRFQATAARPVKPTEAETKDAATPAL
jgi:hypothetical protein